MNNEPAVYPKASDGVITSERAGRPIIIIQAEGPCWTICIVTRAHPSRQAAPVYTVNRDSVTRVTNKTLRLHF